MFALIFRSKDDGCTLCNCQVSNFSVSAEEGLHLKLSGSKAELEGATVTLVFSRFVPTTEGKPNTEASLNPSRQGAIENYWSLCYVTISSMRATSEGIVVQTCFVPKANTIFKDWDSQGSPPCTLGTS